MKAKQPTDQALQSKAMDNTLPDGKYLTCPKWGYSEREVVIEKGEVSLVNEGKYKFSQSYFFEVNDVLKTLPM